MKNKPRISPETWCGCSFVAILICVTAEKMNIFHALAMGWFGAMFIDKFFEVLKRNCKKD